MTARQCDRCGNFYAIVVSNRSRITTIVPNKTYREFDLCPDCTADFEMWIKNKDSIVVKEQK